MSMEPTLDLSICVQPFSQLVERPLGARRPVPGGQPHAVVDGRALQPRHVAGRHLPRDVTWYGDPSGAREIKELRCAGVVVRRGDNDERPGIAAVRARLEDGSLRVVAGSCPNLLAESGLYRYDPEARGKSEKPIKEHDHALDALRYLISRIDDRRMARIRQSAPLTEPAPEVPAQPASTAPPATSPPAKQRKWLSIYNEELWTRLD